ncbi:hypothetical protein KUCAC02_035016, partial [Chaenocephalus aceratus]
VKGTQVKRTQVEGTQVEGTQVEGTQVKGTQVEGTQVKGTQVEGTQVEGTQVKGTRVKGTRVKGTRAEGTRAKGTRAKGTRAEGTRAEGKRAKGTRAKGTRVKGTQVEGTQVEGTQRDGDLFLIWKTAETEMRARESWSPLLPEETAPEQSPSENDISLFRSARAFDTRLNTQIRPDRASVTRLAWKEKQITEDNLFPKLPVTASPSPQHTAASEHHFHIIIPTTFHDRLTAT